MKLLKGLKRPLAFLVAVSLLITSLSSTGNAADGDQIRLIPARQVFRGKYLNTFGKTHRDMNIYQLGNMDGSLPDGSTVTLCIQEGKKLPDFSPATYEYYEVKPGQTVPVIGSFERFLAMALAYEWLMSENYYDPARYGVVQVYFWGCMAGYEHNWPMQQQVMVKLSSVMSSPSVMMYFEEMKDYIIQGESEYNGTTNSALPSWSGSNQKMVLKDGHYELTLDISTCPQLKDTVWTLPDGNWSYQLSTDGNSITFRYNGAAEPRGNITSAELQGIETKYYAYLFTPAASGDLQKQFGWMDLERPTATASFMVDFAPTTPDTPNWEIYRHSETFESNYNIDLEKYCAETNQTLEAATFNVWEDFDFSQVSSNDYKEGNPDGSTGEVYLNCMSPEPENDYLCDTITTDHNGHASHSDVRNYNYSKLYCMGHPAPEWIECDHEGGEGEEVEECSCDEENQRLRDQWMAEQELCASTSDFHVGNSDEENREKDTSAMEDMVADRDATYENFIALEYSYNLQEKTARTGYILHNKHNDDESIETVILTSAQAGGRVKAGSYRSGRGFGGIADRMYKSAERLLEQRVYTYYLPEGQEQELDEQRSVVNVINTVEEEPLIEAPSKNEAGNNGETGSGEEGGDSEAGEEESGDTEGGEGENGDTEGGEEESEDTEGGEGENGDTEGGEEESGDTEGGEEESGDTEGGEEESGDTEGGEEESGDTEGGEESGDTEGGEESGDTEGGEERTDTETGEGDTEDTGREIACSPQKSRHKQLRLSVPAATRNDAEKNDTTDNDFEDKDREDELEVIEEYQYTRNPIEPVFDMEITIETYEPSQKEGNGVIRFFTSLFSDDGEGESVSVSLPAIQDDFLTPMDVSSYGDPYENLYTFKVWDHRTEGRIHINKRDLELHQGDPDGSYGQTQGDGTLEGAVYGLFAAQDIIHPDGKSGVIYNQNNLVAVAATDKKGDASFLVCTEKPGTSLDKDGNIAVLAEDTGAENLYNGSSITSSSQGFGTLTYPDFLSENGNQWIGRPLLMGNYYIMEISRSEGYELSVKGINLTESNRAKDGIEIIRESGSAFILGGLSDYNSMWADGSWNNFMVDRYKTENGYDIVVAGYPAGTKFYQIEVQSGTETIRDVIGNSMEPKRDAQGNIVYQTANGGEYKTDSSGNPIFKTGTATGSETDKGTPYGETLFYRFRTAPYPSGTGTPEDMSKWNQAIDEAYLKTQVNIMLGQIGYKPGEGAEGAPWKDIELTGSDNSQAATEILDWFTDHNFFDCGTVDSIYQDKGTYYARVFYDYSAGNDACPAVYDSVNRQLYVRKTAQVQGGPSGEVHYWMVYENREFSLSSRTVSVKEKKAIDGEILYGINIDSLIKTIYQPVYETYAAGELLLDTKGNPIPVLERVYTYGEREITCDKEVLKAVTAAYDNINGTYTIHMDNDRDWTDVTGAVTDTFRAVTDRTTMEHEGTTMLYNQYLTDIAGASVAAYSSIPALDTGSYIKTCLLAYPGQNIPTQDGGTGTKPIQVLQRSIKQSVKITKDISQASYDDVNTYGSIHNDPLTVLLGLFTGGGSAQGTKILNQFKFKLYLKSNLENIYVDNTGTIVSEDIGRNDFKKEVQRIFLPPKDGSGQALLETREDGTYNYAKFFDAMDGADQKKGGAYPEEVIRQFAITYYKVDEYKKEILAAESGLNSDTAYKKALERAMEEAESYLDIFQGLSARLSIAWDSDPGGGADKDTTTLQCNTKNGIDDYYNHSIMLPYGTYVIAEQTPADIDRELANRHYTKDYPRELTLPFVPDISADGNTGKTEVNYQTGSLYYRYDSTDTPEALIRKYKIRFNEESHIIRAHSHDGDFQVFKYGLDKETRPGHSLTSEEPYEVEYLDGRNDTVKSYYTGYTSQSEDRGTIDSVVYNGYETNSGQVEVRDNVAVMTGMQTAIDGKFASMLVPWTVLAPAVDRVNPDTGNVETLVPSGEGADFNFVAFAHEDFENTYFNSKLRIEKLDAETGDNIIHDGALFKIYAAKREVEKNGNSSVAGTGDVLFGEAVDWEGNPVMDADGIPILYPRVGQDNNSFSDLPVRLDKEGIPQYDETQLVRQEDEKGSETGIFKAGSTVREVDADGQIQKEQVGYIETYKPLGAGAYVLVEIQAPEGYTKSRPVAFEVYADDVVYYEDQREKDGTTAGWRTVTAERFQYAVPVSGATNKFQTETVSQIKVQDYPSRMEIHKVEDGDSMIGNQNALLKTDAQGQTELSGGFDHDIKVNDRGDLLLYTVEGRKEKLEERGDVRDITLDPETGTWYGFVTKIFDEYSERMVEGTEKALKAMPNVKLLYELDGTFTGKGIDFSISVSNAQLSLYRAIEIQKIGDNQYKGVTALAEDGRVTEIRCTNTGTHKEIRKTGRDTGPAELDIWDVQEVENQPVNLFFYDLGTVDTRMDSADKELLVLDSRGNKLCYADSITGMAYVYDDYGRMLAYIADEAGSKELVHSIQVMNDGRTETIYENKTTADDENGLPLYYTGGNIVTKEESWITDSSMDPYGKQETSGGVHTITRLPFGAYILQEELVPYDQGYIQAEYLGLVLEDREEIQKYFLQNEFTKTAIAKVDVRTQKEIQGAAMTLYKAQLDEEGNVLTEDSGLYLKGEAYASWLSGYEYDDKGNLKVDASGQPVVTLKPHWMDHIPVGYYVLEETICPYDQGYVQAQAVNIYVSETGRVQSFTMEDDFTSLDIWKYDTKNEDTLYKDSHGYLTLYHAKLDEGGSPVCVEGVPLYEDEGRIFTFRAATYEDGQKVAATGRVEPDAGGNNPIIKYDYNYKDIPNTLQGRFYYTENGTVRLEYLPVGSYVLVETGNPEGYATADPVLIRIEDRGHLEKLQYAEMGDQPLKLEVSKVNITGGKEVNGAVLTIYPVDEQGNVSHRPLILHQPAAGGTYQDITATWISGLDGRYTEEDEKAGRIPDGFQMGDLKPHLAEYIPEGKYILREETTPYGFLQSVDVPFSIIDSQLVQKVEMINEIPQGILKLVKSDAERPEERLEGVEFRLMNKTLNLVCQTVTTNVRGEAQFRPQPIGYMDKDGNFEPYTYECREMKGAAGHMLTLKPFEFQFQYENEYTGIITLEYNPVNDSNRTKTDKLLGDTNERLEGAVLGIERRTGENTWEIVDEWITGRQTHYTKDLEAGDYRLVEMKAPDGFKMLAEPVLFTITDGMTEIPQLIMRNYASIVEIQKIGDSGALLAGARLQLIHKDTKTLIREWTSQEEKGQVFHGLEAGIYIIRELEAPSGYKKGLDREITVTDNNSNLQVFKYENKVVSSGRGGGSDNPKPAVAYIAFKKVDGAGRVLSGAEFTFYNQDGSVMSTSVSDNRGYFYIKKPGNGTYTFRETKAPAGYALSSQIYSFTVSEGAVIRGIYQIVNKKLEVPVRKVDAATGEFLSGARLNIRARGDYEEIISELVTGEDGSLVFHISYPGTYYITESEAPEGYRLTEEVYEVTVSDDGQVRGNTTVYNFNEKLPVKTMGRITANYRIKSRLGRGSYRFGPGRDSSIQTGDNSPFIQVSVAGILCLAGFIICIKSGVKEKKKLRKAGSGAEGAKGGGKNRKVRMRGKCLWMLISVCLLTGLCSSRVDVVMAMETEISQTAAKPEDAFYVSGQITYYHVETTEQIPQRAWITAEDYITGEKREVVLPLTDYNFINEKWTDDFQMEVTVIGYGADVYLLGTELVDGKGEGDFSAYEEALLKLAGIEKDRFRIENTRWKGDAYEKEGRICRDLEVIGKKLTGDCSATYAGMVNREIFKRKAKEEKKEGELIPRFAYRGGNWRFIVSVILLLTVAVGLALCYKNYGPYVLLRLAALLFLIGSICCGAFLIKTCIIYEKGRSTYEVIEKAAYGDGGEGRRSIAYKEEAIENEEGQEPVPAINESWLKSFNPDYRLWLSIPGAGIEYPVVQGEDNQYYLTHNFNREEHLSGSIFLDSSVQPLITDNTLIYGHNMKDGSMFGNLKRFREEAFYLENPYVRIFYKGEWMDCPVLSCQLRSETDFSPCRKNFLKAEWPAYLEEMKAASLYSTNCSLTGSEKIITFSTCFGSKQRLTLQVIVPENN